MKLVFHTEVIAIIEVSHFLPSSDTSLSIISLVSEDHHDRHTANVHLFSLKVSSRSDYIEACWSYSDINT